MKAGHGGRRIVTQVLRDFANGWKLLHQIRMVYQRITRSPSTSSKSRPFGEQRQVVLEAERRDPSNAGRSNFHLSPESLIHRASDLAARLPAESASKRHPRLGFSRRERLYLDRQLGVIAHPGERLGKFEHVVLGEILRFNRSGHEDRITAK